MSFAEDTLSSFTIIIVVLSVVLVSFSVYTSFSGMRTQNLLNEQEQRFQEDLLNTVLELKEPQSGMTVDMLLGTFFYDQSDTFETPNGKIMINDTMGQMFDYFYGRGKYYMRVKPIIRDIKMYFVIDGSGSTEDIRENLSIELPSFIGNLEEMYGYDVIAKAYLLTKTSSRCDPFISNGTPCETLAYDELYETIDEFPSPYDPTTLESIGKNYFATSDWATGVGIVSRENAGFTPSRLEVIIPISNEVALGTKKESCYTMGMQTLYDQYAVAYCLECEEKVDYSTSWAMVDRINDTLLRNNHIVAPINAFRCDYTMSSSIKNYLDGYYNMQGWSVPSDYCSDTHCPTCADASVCSSNPLCSGGNCPDCPSACSAGSAFRHPEGYSELNDQFFHLANETGGENFTLSQLHEMYDDIEGLITDVIAGYELEVGEKRADESRVAFTKVLPFPMANDAYMEVYFEYYDEITYQSVDRYVVKPTIRHQDYDNTTKNFSCVLRSDTPIDSAVLNIANDTVTHTYPLSFDSQSIEAAEPRFAYSVIIPLTSSDSFNFSMTINDTQGDTNEIKNFGHYRIG